MVIKKLFPLIVFIATTLFASCEKNSSADILETEQYVNIGFTPLTAEIEEEPLLTTRNTNNDLYGLQIFETGGEEGSDLGTSCVCWVTDNLAKSSISLQKGKRYACYLVYVPDGKNLIYKKGNNYGNPFFHLGPDSSPIYDFVHYGSHYDMNFARYGASRTKDKQSYFIQTNFWNQVDIYYGCTRIKVTKAEDVQIDLYRMMFGLNIKATNFTNGKLVTYSLRSNDSYQAAKENDGYIYELTPTEPEIDLVLELVDMPWRELPEKYKEWKSSDQIAIDYITETGRIIPIVRQGLAAQRMKRYVLELDIEELIDEVEDDIIPNIIEEEWSDVSLDEFNGV